MMFGSTRALEKIVDVETEVASLDDDTHKWLCQAAHQGTSVQQATVWSIVLQLSHQKDLLRGRVVSNLGASSDRTAGQINGMHATFVTA